MSVVHKGRLTKVWHQEVCVQERSVTGMTLSSIYSGVEDEVTSICRRGVHSIEQRKVSIGEKWRGYDRGKHVYRTGVWRVCHWAVCTGEE